MRTQRGRVGVTRLLIGGVFLALLACWLVPTGQAQSQTVPVNLAPPGQATVVLKNALIANFSGTFNNTPVYLLRPTLGQSITAFIQNNGLTHSYTFRILCGNDPSLSYSSPLAFASFLDVPYRTSSSVLGTPFTNGTTQTVSVGGSTAIYFSTAPLNCPAVLLNINSVNAPLNDTFTLAVALSPSGTDGQNAASILINGTPPLTVTALNESTNTTNVGGLIVEKGSRWDVLSAPAVSAQATASKAAGGITTRHVADCVSYSGGATTAPAATQLTINLRDGASGAGTVIWTKTVVLPATVGTHIDGNFCGLNLTGSVNTAMTLEFSALLTNEFESVTLTGYDVQ